MFIDFAVSEDCCDKFFLLVMSDYSHKGHVLLGKKKKKLFLGY